MAMKDWFARWAIPAALLLFAASCGPEENNGGGSGQPDAAADVFDDTSFNDTGMDAGSDTGMDGSSDPDTSQDGGSGAERTVCPDALPAAPTGSTCSVTAGSPDVILLQGVVLADDGVYENGGVLIDRSTGENATMTCVGCGCADEASGPAPTVVSCPDSVISPGLINAHEHLGWGTKAPVPHGDARYDHRHDWRTGARGNQEIRSGGSDFSGEALLYGELRHLLSGATAVAGSTRGSGPAGLLRNMSNADATGGLNLDVDYETFPLGDTRGTLAADGCSAYDLPGSSALSSDIYLPHVGEGIDPEAQNEYHCLSGINAGSVDVVEANTSIIHGIGMQATDIADFAASASSLVWSPRTNIDLYGNTADVITYANYGVNIALGTDWVISGSMNMTRELACIDYLNQNHYSNFFTDRQLWQMATTNGAKALGVGDQLGKIAEGYIADIAIYSATRDASHRAVLEAGVADVQLVLRGGKALLGERALIEGLRADAGACDALDVCGGERLICASEDTGSALSDLLAQQTGYELFYCDTPVDEPSCVPFRLGEYDGMSMADDQDGDGVPDAQDTCPTFFNPERPVDDGSQADFDGDGLGDACDLCPTTAGESCDPFDPNDRDADGEPNASDNCPALANADQADRDNDDVGDACDACPDAPNPDGLGCPGTIYEVRDGTISPGESVYLSDVVVTAADPDEGLFVQVPEDRADFAGVDNSALNVFVDGFATLPSPGDRIDVSGTVTDYFGLAQISTLTALTVNSSGPAPDPVLVDPADVATGGSRADALQSVLIRVDDVTVTDANPDAPNDYGEFEVDGLRVDDLLYEVLPDPQAGDTFDALVGPLYYSFGNTKLVPRSADDVIDGPPRLVSIAPALVYIPAGSTNAATTPSLNIVLSRAPSAPMTVDLSYGNTNIVDGPASVDVPAGQTRAEVLLDGNAVGSTTVTASMGGDSFDANVEVYDAAAQRALASLTPATQTIQITQSGTVTVTLDAPAGPGGVDVTMSATGGVSVASPLTVLAGALSADATVTAGANPGPATVSASLGATTLDVDVTVTDAPSTPCLIISEYIEGSGRTNKAIELYNCGPTTFDLSNFGVCLVSNDNTSCNATTALASSSLAAGQVYTICNSTTGDAVDAIKNNCDEEISSVMNFNGDDRLLVFEDTNTDASFDPAVDVITDALGETTVEPATDPWKDTLLRRCNITPYDGTTPFDASVFFNAYSPTETGDWGQPPSESCN